MSEPLEELRAQRALIQQHLDWLDARIAATEGSSAEPTLPHATSQPCSTQAPVADEIVEVTDQTDVPFFDIDQTTHASTTSDIRKAQIGCLVIFVIAILGFVFLLFGLPYLVD